MTKTLCLKMKQFTKIMIKGLLVKLLSSYFGVEVPPEYVLGEGSDQEEETPLPPIDRGRPSGEAEGSRTAPRTIEEQDFETPNPRLRAREWLSSIRSSEWVMVSEAAAALRRSSEWALRDRGSASEAAAAVREWALRDRGEPSGSHQVLEPESSQASTSRGTTGDLPQTPEKPPNPRSCGSKRPREDSDSDEEV